MSIHSHPSHNTTANATPLTLRILTELDQVRLEKLLRERGLPDTPDDAPGLNEVIDLAQIVSSKEVPPQVATLNSRLQVKLDDGTNTDAAESKELTLCWPQDADASRGAISVLSPIGTALLGLSEGHRTQWSQADGRIRHASLTRVLYQPEAHGEYTR